VSKSGKVRVKLQTLQEGTRFSRDENGGRPGILVRLDQGSATVQVKKPGPSLSALLGTPMARRVIETWPRQTAVWVERDRGTPMGWMDDP
jgi:hypothetical protein